MLYKDARTPNALSKHQLKVLEKEVKPIILAMFNLTKDNTKTREKRASLIVLLETLQQYLGDNSSPSPNNHNYHVSPQSTHSIISKLKEDLNPTLLTVSNQKVISMLILSTSTMLETFEEVLGYLSQFKPQLEPTGNIYYIVPLNHSDSDFVLYRFSLDVLTKQFNTLSDADLI